MSDSAPAGMAKHLQIAHGRRAPAARRRRLAALALVVPLVAGCISGPYDRVELMPPPTIYAETGLDPFAGLSADSFGTVSALNYVTDRRPATAEEPQAHYADARGYLIRAGVASIRITPGFTTWDEVRAVTLAGEGATPRVLRVGSVAEDGVLPAGLTPFNIGAPPEDEMEAAADSFAARVDRQMALSGAGDVFIYVHGYNVNFEYPLLVAKEIQHFLGYRGAFIAFAWPATPNRFAYFKDVATVEPTIRNLRALIDFLDKRTEVERIHLIGYSAGSRLAFGAAYRMALEAGRPATGPAPRLASLTLIASDLDPAYFLQGVADGLMDVAGRVAVYMSARDSALDLSRFFLSRRRLGQTWSPDMVPPELEARLAETERLELIDVSFASGAGAGDGHAYFRSSPWVSSDLYLSLRLGEPAAARGLRRAAGEAIWRFPRDYPSRLDAALRAARGS